MRTIALIPLLLMLLTACARPPAGEEIERLVVAAVEADPTTTELFSVENFAKVNGFQESDNVYYADVTYDLVFRKGLDQYADEVGSRAGDPKQLLGALGEAAGVVALRMEYGEFKRGDRRPVARKVRLIRTEKGWRLDDRPAR